MASRRPFRFIPVTRLEGVVLGELLKSLAVSLGGLTLLIVIAGAYRPIREGLPVGALLRFLPLSIPYFLPWTLPTSFVAATMMVYSRMAASNELTAIRAAGVHLWRVFSPAMLIAVILCIACGWLNNLIVPAAYFRQWAMLRAPTPSQLAAGILYSDPVMRIGDHSFHMREVTEDQTIRDLVVMMPEGGADAAGDLAGTGQFGFGGDDPSEQKPKRRDKSRPTVLFIRAPRGRFAYSDQRSQITFHVMEDPARNTAARPHAGWCSLVRQEFGSSVRNFEEAWFRSATLTLHVKSIDDLRMSKRKFSHLTSTGLLLMLQSRREDMGSRPQPAVPGQPTKPEREAERKWQGWRVRQRKWETELHKRAALALAPLLLGAIACPLAVLAARGRRLVAFAMALAIVLGLYYPLAAGGRSMGKSGMLPPVIALWGANLVVGALGAYLIRRMLKQ
jgi:lipopolysaccharide export system permease protein